MSLLDAHETAGALAAGVESTLERLTEADVASLQTELMLREYDVEHLRESLADLSLAFEDRGWSRVDGGASARELTRAAVENASQLARTMAVANPLIRRGLNLRIAYVWGSGVSINAKATGESDGEQDVNAVVQGFLDDPAVRKVLTSAGARERNERSLGTDGNLLLALVTAPRTGAVQPRVVPFSEVQRVVKNPDDATDVWLYQRAVMEGNERVVYYHPDVDFRPRVRIQRITPATDSIGGGLTLPSGHQLEAGEVRWDAPVMHLKVNDMPEWDFGIGDAFAAVSWARAYKEFLEDWAKLVKALSRFAWRATSETKGAAQRAAERIRQTPAVDSTVAGRAVPGIEGRPVGQTFANAGVTLEAIPKTGATIDSGSGRPLAAMVASGLDVPVTMLLADPGVTGARATAETLDKPTELMAGGRRDVWGDFLRRLLDYVIDQAVKAPAGPLSGQVTRDEWGREVIVLEGDTTRTLDIAWPDLTDTSVDVLLSAIAKADATEKLPPLLLVRLMLAAFNVRDPDEWLDKVTDPQTGEYVAPGVTAGDLAAQAFRAGQDPAAALA